MKLRFLEGERDCDCTVYVPFPSNEIKNVTVPKESAYARLNRHHVISSRKSHLLIGKQLILVYQTMEQPYARTDIKESMLHILLVVYSPGAPFSTSLRKTIALPCHADHEFLALHCTGEPIAQRDAPEHTQERNAMLLQRKRRQIEKRD
jgi:hypothetical protein